MAKPKILYLCHRIPYPPNKGDKIRSFNVLKALAEYFEVYLGCFVDDEYDWQYQDRLTSWCSEYKCLPQHKTLAKLKGLTSFLTGKSITEPYYFDARMQLWVDETIKKHQITKVFIFSSAMAQYVDQAKYSHLHRVIDFVDVDSDKWRQYAQSHQGLMKWVYQREHHKLQQAEQKYCERFNHSVFVSPDEAALFRSLMPSACSEKITHLLNGVDVDFFAPEQAATVTATEVPLNRRYLVFTGAMDYWANVDAVRWFADEVWPALVATQPDLHFIIAGGNPTAEVKALALKHNIVVTGRVKDVRPYIQHALFVVAPLRIARGIQNKVLEAMSLNKAVVATDMAMEGINAPQSPWLRQTDSAETFIAYCMDLLQNPVDDIGARQWVIENFTWQATLAPLQQLVTEA